MKRFLTTQNLSYLLTIFLVAWCTHYIYSHQAEFAGIRQVSTLDITILLVVALIDLVIQGYLTQVTLKPFGIHLQRKEWFGLKTAQLMGNYMIPFGGLGIRMAYLKKKFNFSYTDNMSTVAVVVMVELIVFATCGLVSLFVIYKSNGSFDWFLSFSLLGITLALILGMAVGRFSIPIHHPFIQKINELLAAWLRMRRHYGFIRDVVFWTFLEFISLAYLFYFAFRALNLPIGAAGASIIACLTDFSLYFRMTPGSIGTYEASIIYPTKFLGLTIADGLLAGTLVRFVTMTWYLTLGPFFSHTLMSGLKKESN